MLARKLFRLQKGKLHPSKCETLRLRACAVSHFHENAAGTATGASLAHVACSDESRVLVLSRCEAGQATPPPRCLLLSVMLSGALQLVLRVLQSQETACTRQRGTRKKQYAATRR